jgi:hypothetical protein
MPVPLADILQPLKEIIHEYFNNRRYTRITKTKS